MPEKTNDNWVNIANDFYRKTQFLNCICAVDGKHIRIKMPTGSGSLLFNTLNARLNLICHLLALLGAHHFLHVSRIRVNYKYLFLVLLLTLIDADY
jgi:hypothetical protein